MNPSKRVRMSMLGIAFVALLLGSSAGAQPLEDVERSLGLGPDPIARSPRMLGMGRLSLVVDAQNNRITMWDFAGNPTGIAESESTSTFDLRPSTKAASDKHDVLVGGLGHERQHLALREMRVGYEAWRRSGTTAYGAIGDFIRLRHDRPYSQDLEVRSEHLQPRIMPVLTGQMPFVFSERMRYALRVQYNYESSADAYRKIVRNAAGEYIDKPGTEVGPPELFTPDEFRQTGRGIGAATSYRFGDPLTVAIGADYISNDIVSLNEGNRHRSEITEDLPYKVGQGTVIGKFGGIEYGVDGRLWSLAPGSVQRWAFTTSSGVGAIPLSARGKRLEHREEGSTLRTRVRWVIGSLELGVGHSTYYRQVKTLAPSLSDTTSFNLFRNRLQDRVSADSLFLPDSVSSDEVEQRVMDVGGAVAWHTLGRRAIVGVEFHSNRDEVLQKIGGSGPKRVGWEARTGAEWLPLDNLALRGGFFHRWEDRDDLTERNEFVTHGVTVGLGLHPIGSIWTLDTGYLVEWTAADFGDPGLSRGSRQQLAMQFAWSF